MRDYRLPPSMRSDPRLLDAIHESIVGADEFAGEVEVAGSTGGQRAVVALQLVDALIANGGFEAVTETERDLLGAADEASEVVGAAEHRSLLESRDTEQWLALQGLLQDRLLAYVESHEHEFFIDSDEAAVTAERVKATFAAHDNDAELAQTPTASLSGRSAGTAGGKRDPGATRCDPLRSVALLTRPVTPEVAGSSPVAPVCRSACK
jgi:hypothetical protein